MSFLKRILPIMLTGSIMLTAVSGCSTKAATTVESLMVDYVENPMGIDNAAPAFYWSMSAPTVRGQKQTAYRIGVASTQKKLKSGDFDVWDSGKVDGDVSIGIPYGGSALSASTRYFWKVTVWDKDGKTVESDNDAWFETGLMEGGFEGASFISQNVDGGGVVDTTLRDANWIWRLDGAGFSSAPEGTEYFRKTFTVDKEISSALLLFSADDYGDIYVNGAKVYEIENVYDRWRTGNAVLITEQLTSGENVVAAAITNASTGYGGFVCKLQIKYTDGSVATYATDDSWKCTKEETEGFAAVSFDDSGWTTPDQAVEYGGSPWGNDVILPATIAGIDGAAGAPILRKSFASSGKVASARLYATAAGLYTVSLNGSKVGDDFLTPGFTEYNEHLMYQTFDVTDDIKKGDNVLTATLGNGWYIGTIGASFGGRFPALLAKLVITYDDGTQQVVNTDSSWEVTLDGPVTANDLFNGETYDARRTEEGFEYQPVSVVSAETLNMGEVISQVAGTNIRCMETVTPVEVTQMKDHLIYDFGQNLTGVLQITVKAEEGTTVTLRHGEMLNDGSGGSDGPVGTLYTQNLRAAQATDTYICGGGKETWSPSFTFHGFRYAEVKGIDQKDIVEVKALVLYSALADSGTFECSETLLNQLSSNAYWGQRSNFVSVPTDCPQRDERMGWSGDAQIFVGTAAYNMEVKQFYEQYIMDLNDCQRDNGAYPDCAPASDRPSYNGSGHGGWADAGIIIPYTLALRYGDISLIEKYYDNMCRYIEYLVTDAGDFIRNSQFMYGDWLSIGENTPIELCDTAYCVYVSRLMSEMSGWLGKTEDAAKFADYSNKFAEAWNGKYLLADGKTGCDTQTSYVLGLYFGIIPENLTQASAARLAEKIADNGNRLTTGFMGVSYLLPVLCEYGYTDTAFALLEQKENPSWLYPVLQGATTIWERWDSYTIEGGFGAAGMNSFNHYSYGSVMEWVYSSLVGIACDPNSPAYKHFILKPTYGGSLTYAKGSYKSAYGLIESGWELKDGELVYTCVVPANTTATLYLPCAEGAAVTEGGSAVTPSGYADGRAVIELESGSYTFHVPAN